MNSRLQIRIDTDLQKNAEAILKEYGYTPSLFLRTMYSYIVKNNELPIEVKKIPNAVTKKAMKESENIEDLTQYQSADAGLKALGL